MITTMEKFPCEFGISGSNIQYLDYLTLITEVSSYIINQNVCVCVCVCACTQWYPAIQIRIELMCGVKWWDPDIEHSNF